MRVSAVVLAAGKSSRMGSNKLLAHLLGSTVIEHITRVLNDMGIKEITVVTGHQRHEIERALASYGCLMIYNPDYQEGMGTSIAAGVSAADPEADGFLIVLGDMPRLTADLVQELIRAAAHDRIVVPTSQGRQGNPVLFGKQFRSQLESLTGDVGARSILQSCQSAVHYLEIEDSSVFDDIDTPLDAERFGVG